MSTRTGWWIGFGLICLGNLLSWAVVIWFLWSKVR